MAMEYTVAQLQSTEASSLADDLAWLQGNRVTHFIEEDGELVSCHGEFVGDEPSLWPSGLGTEQHVDHHAQWYVDAVGISLVSRTAGKVYMPTLGIPIG